jgi:hypothetical protein
MDLIARMMADRPPPPPDILTFADIETDHAVLVAKEAADGVAIRSIGTTSVLGLKPVFVDWYSKGCPNSFPVYAVTVTPPPVCSDGIARSLPEYVTFCSGAPIQDHVALFQARLPDIRVSYANLQGAISVIVSKV